MLLIIYFLRTPATTDHPPRHSHPLTPKHKRARTSSKHHSKNLPLNGTTEFSKTVRSTSNFDPPDYLITTAFSRKCASRVASFRINLSGGGRVTPERRKTNRAVSRFETKAAKNDFKRCRGPNAPLLMSIRNNTRFNDA